MAQPAQQIRFCTSRDGTRIAYAICGAGPPLVWVQHWIHHLTFDWDSPIWRPWLSLLTRRHTVIRFDWRGCGLSDRDQLAFTFEKLTEDLEAVVRVVGYDRFVLFGMSAGGSGVAIKLAIRHPDQVARLILYGSQTMGRWAGNPAPELVQEGEARLKMYELGWPNQHPAYGQFFTALHIPDASIAQKTAHNDLLRQTTSSSNAVSLLRAFYRMDLSDLMPQVQCPTLVLHARGEAVIPFEQGRKVAALLTDARFSPLESRNHLLLDTEPCWQRLTTEIENFLPASLAQPAGLSFDGLTARERDVLEVLAQGLNNNEIAARLKISQKTARNHLSAIFSKLGVSSRAQAIVIARDAGFGHRSVP